MSSIPTYHDQTTSATGEAGTSQYTTDSTTQAPAASTYAATDAEADAIMSANRNTPATDSTTNDNNEYRPRLNSEYEPTTSIDQQRGSLSSTVGPFQVPTTDDVSKSEVPPTSSVGQQNAPTRGGEIGEKAMGAFGYGGATVERPKEEQGVAEKIVNFLGA